ncbi:carboxypeptidase regulatory-like domain-containing protein [Chryseobacterium sp. JUb7]|uniref:carboxypeptidase regulatory-like domain-containing protein n=1 Tax=Chryseobacterium sp. JUb7 TaxID=2940599 RepID=UPI0021688907|nr:carboxypeptidase regulatory-like domain-containing protein [Chryseobacterium sp. JUb7]MCS3530906.1 hypothetical protein [Chryseobacterium sp. JUb7]
MVKGRLGFVLLFLCGIVFSQEMVTGKITDQDNAELGFVIVINMSTDQKTYSNSVGEFSISASQNDELRFVKKGYERNSARVLIYGINSKILIRMIKTPEEIEEVKVARKDDATRRSKGEQVRDAVGLPQPKGKMREKPAEVKQVLLPILLGQLNVQGVYDLISGKARRQKRAYRYDDLQEHILWVRSRVDDDYFTELGIPAERISEFIEFSFSENPHIRTYVRSKNVSGVLFRMEEVVPIYLERLKTRKKDD